MATTKLEMVPGVPEDSREVMNWGLRKAMDELDKARDPGAMWGPSAEPLVVLAQIKAARKILEDTEKWAVSELRADDVPWSAIGEALGVTRQAAQMRFSGNLARPAAPDLRACCDHEHHTEECPVEGCDCDGWSPTTSV